MTTNSPKYNFLYGAPDPRTTGNARVDIRRMKPYPGESSTAEKKLFTGRANALVIPAGTSANENIRMALDSLFNHPNVGPFIGRQLIQRLVTSNPSREYVTRVAQAFNNNGSGVRGDMSAVVRAILMDPEARSSPTTHFGKIREPVLRVAQWMRSLGARSASGECMIDDEPGGVGQRPNFMPSVFGYFRPGYIPPSTSLSALGLMAPEMQLVDEATSASWINGLELMLVEGLGWYQSARDVSVPMTAEGAMLGSSPMALTEHLNLLLFAGEMSPALRKNIIDAMVGVDDGVGSRDVARARVAVYIAMTSPEYLVQR